MHRQERITCSPHYTLRLIGGIRPVNVCETKEGRIDRIERDLEFSRRLTEEQSSKPFEIAQKCPVHRSLVSEIDIRTRVL